MRLLFFFFLTFTGLSCAQTDAQAQTKTSVANFEALLAQTDAFQLVDVRTPEEYAEGHLEGAQLINFYAGGFSTQLEQLDKKQPVLVYCASGNRSGKTAVLLGEMGFEKIYDLDGGIKAWRAAGKKTVE
ncbi:MAG: rhodanese-like domain-containing protein [Lewinellaceae bacterium]|nr:rhodanese-like domain-containing protein [Lewinellaceae bacterium]